MLNYRFDKEHSILNIKVGGPLEVSDFSKVSARIDPVIEENGALAGVILEAKEFPGWKNIDALFEHIRWVKQHHGSIKKLATVTDNGFVKSVPNIMKHVLPLEVRNFHEDQKREAKSWIKGTYEPPASLETIPFPHDPVIGMVIRGTVTKDDIVCIEEAVAEKVKTHKKLGIYVELDHWEGFTLDGLWEDLNLAFRNMKYFDKKVVVSNELWVKKLTNFVDKLNWPIKVKCFPYEEKEKALKWIKR